MKRLLSSALLCLSFPMLAQPVAAAEHLQYLNAAKFVPAQILPAPAAHGSAQEVFEIAELHRLLAKASPRRLAQAKADSDNENPSLFNNVLGFDLRSKPASWALLTLVQSEAEIATSDSKLFFHRMRPYSADPSIPFCEYKPNPAKPEFRSYPSGHSTLGYSVGWVLAHLMPQKADVILARAKDYGLSREYCGAHFPSDIEASHVVGTMVGIELLADARLADKIAAARAELSNL
ncbi:MAG: phosphatase PAP2 family protein [Sphingomonadales bacterium]|nr:phosphatase PAP2 family protein [Sphingomonadales bacterium]MDE2171584.1 phosphatase PAP2 family protein [Sphingomonadales bacterium]